MAKTMTKRAKAYDRMTADELQEATKEFDAEMVGVPGEPLSADEVALHRRAKRRGRPTVGKGARKVMVSMEKGLLTRADRYAKQQSLSRSQLIAMGIEEVLKGPTPQAHRARRR